MREGFTLLNMINVLCVIKGFYRTSIVTLEKKSSKSSLNDQNQSYTKSDPIK